MTKRTAKGAVEKKPRQSRKNGRPSIYSKKLADTICTRIAGGESLRSVCRDDGMPVLSTVLLWVVDDREGFSEQYHRAREAAGYSHADEALDMRHQLYSGELDHQSARVILDALKWGAERMAPKKHSPRQEVDHSSEDGSMTPKGLDASTLSDATLKELMDARRAKPE